MSRRSKEYRETPGQKDKPLYASAEVLIPKTFTSNGRKQTKGNTILMQYLQHSTHSREADEILDGEVARFKGNSKFARLYTYNCRGTWYIPVMSWKAADGGTSLEPLLIKRRNSEGKKYKRSEDCCCVIAEENCQYGYTILADMTCKAKRKGAQVCNGECYTAEKVFPGSYVWFGISEIKDDDTQDSDDDTQDDDDGTQDGDDNTQDGDDDTQDSDDDTQDGDDDTQDGDDNSQDSEPALRPLQSSTPEEFKEKWCNISRYGTRSFIVEIKELLDNYLKADFVPAKRGIVLRCGGTLLYTKEVCYVVIITFEGDGIHDDKDFPPINPHDAKASPQCDWSPLLDEDGCYKHKAEYPMFTPHHTNYFWDHIVFAIHIPKGKELSIPKMALVGGKPLKTEHDKFCHKHRIKGREAVDVCKAAEVHYKKNRRKASSKPSHKKHAQK